MKTATLQGYKSQVMKPYKMESGKIAALIVAGILALGATPLMATTIVPGDYAKSFAITFPGYSGSETLTDFPVLVKVSAARNDFDYSACQVANGGDLRFADASGNLLSSEVDTWNTSGESLVWVKVPSFSKDTVITAYYGNANPPAVNASDVWSNGYVGVWHLNESAAPLAESSGISTPFVVPLNTKDRTTYATNGVAGGKSVSFDNEYYGDGNHNRLEAADDPDLRGLTNFTIECWTYQEKYRGDNDATIIGARSNWKLYQGISGELSSRWMKANGTTVWGLSTPSGPALNKWTYQTFVRNFTSASSADTTWYLNGGSVATKTESNAESTGNGGEIKHALGGGDNIRVFPGSIDEARVSNVARSADWVKASHDCVVDEDFASFAATENDWAKYSHKFRVTFAGYTGGETLANFPVLVKISESGITGFRYSDCKKPYGGDLRFADAEGNLLASEVDTWDTNGVSLVWVKVPSLTADTKITAYYGWDFAPVVDSSAVWKGNGYVGVWHLNESSVPLAESSGGSSPLTAGEKPEYANCGATGIVGKSVDFDNYGSYKSSYGSPRVQAADDDGRLSGFTNFTVECWTYQTNYWGAESGVMIGVMAKGNGSDRSWRMYQINNEGGYLGLELTDSEGSRKWRDAGQCAPSGKWTHQMFVRNRTDLNKCLFYVNGENVASRDDGCVLQLQSNTKPLIVGGGGENNARIFPGSIDEVRVSNVARSADWVKATHDTVTEPSFAKYGAAKENVKTGMFIIFR